MFLLNRILCPAGSEQKVSLDQHPASDSEQTGAFWKPTSKAIFSPVVVSQQLLFSVILFLNMQVTYSSGSQTVGQDSKLISHFISHGYNGDWTAVLPPNARSCIPVVYQVTACSGSQAVLASIFASATVMKLLTPT